MPHKLIYILILTASSLFMSKNLSISAPRRRTFVTMALTEKNIDQSSTKKKSSDSIQDLCSTSTKFKNSPSSAAGIDERYSFVTNESQLESDGKLLTKLEISYQNCGLLSQLTSPTVGLNKKLELIDTNVKLEFLSGSYNNEATPMKIEAGGLMTDWEYLF